MTTSYEKEVADFWTIWGLVFSPEFRTGKASGEIW